MSKVMCAFGCEPECREVLSGFRQELLYEFTCKHGSEMRRLSIKQRMLADRRGELPRSFTSPIHELKYIQATRVPRSLLLFNRKRKDPRKLGFVP